MSALRRACALGGVSLAFLTPGARAQTAPAQTDPATAARVRAALAAMTPAARAEALARYGFRELPDGRIAPRIAPGTRTAVQPANAAAARVMGGGPSYGALQDNPFGLGPFTQEVPTSDAAPAVIDLDGDGDLDVLAGSDQGALNFFENTAAPGQTPVFAAPGLNPFSLATVGPGSKPTVGDLDGDGDLDVLVGIKTGELFFFRNTAGAGATPAFGMPELNPFGLQDVGDAAAPRLIDLNGDGALDVLVGNKSGDLVYFENTPGPDGEPQFAEPQTNPFGLAAVGSQAHPTVGDLDGDGDLDVLVGNKGFTFNPETNTVATFSNLVYFENTPGPEGEPAFGSPQTNPFGFEQTTDTVVSLTPAITDLDGDGDADVLIGQPDGFFGLYTNAAGSGPQTPAFGPLQPDPNGLTQVRSIQAATQTTVAQGDVDGDGDVDVLVGTDQGTLSFFENTAGAGQTPAFGAPQVNPFGLSRLGYDTFPALADLDGDGDLDVLVGFQNSQFAFFENTAGPGVPPVFSAAQVDPFGLPSSSSYRAPAVADLDGDGDLDVLVGTGNGDFGAFLNTGGPDGPPAFGEVQLNPFGLTSIGGGGYPPLLQGGGGGQTTPTVGDIDGDGDLDVVAGDFSGTLTVFVNAAGPRATPAFGPASPGGFGLTTSAYFYAAPSLADLDGDGDLDVLVGAGNGGFTYQQNDGTVGPITASLDGATGYRMLAAPTATPLGTLLGSEIFTQGFPGAVQEFGPPTVYLYDETVPGDKDLGFVAPASIGDAVGNGRGAFVYVFEDEDPRPTSPDVQGGFPKTLTATGRPALVDFDWGAGGDAALSFTDTGAALDDGWNLLGNPFGSWFDWDAVDLQGVNAPVYVYDNVSASYLSHSRGIPNAGSLPGGIVGPFQGFWVQTNAASAAITARSAVTSGGPLYRGTAPATVVGLRLRPGAGSDLPAGIRSEAYLALGVAGSEAGLSPLDALALAPPAQSYVLLSTQATRPDGLPAALSIDARPVPAGTVTVELNVAAVAGGAAVGTALVLDWPGLALPVGWRAQLLDRATGALVEMTAGGAYPFALAGPARGAAPDALAFPALGPAPSTAEALGGGRFALVVTPRGATAGEAAGTQTLALSAARPNPTTGAATLTLSLPAASDVRAAVYDVLGREVAVLAAGPLAAGEHALRLDAGTLPAGTYVVRASVGPQVLTQRLTVAR